MSTRRHKSSTTSPSVDDERARFAKLLGDGLLSGAGWRSDARGIPRLKESEQISLRLPKKLLEVIRVLAKRREIGYQILLKDWLDDRAHLEAKRELARGKSSAEGRSTVIVAFPMERVGSPSERLVETDDPLHHRVERAA